MATSSPKSGTSLGPEDAITAAGMFLDPVLRKGERPVDHVEDGEIVLIRTETLVQARGKSLVERLVSQIPGYNALDSGDARTIVLDTALSHLKRIHLALIGTSDTRDHTHVLYNTRHQVVIDGLLDLISLEGIYPALSTGVGIPIERRVNSVLQGGITARPVAPSDHRDAHTWEQLEKIIDTLSRIVLGGDRGVNRPIRERILVDILSGCGELTYRPAYANITKVIDYKSSFNALMDKYVTSFRIVAVPGCCKRPTLARSSLLNFSCVLGHLYKLCFLFSPHYCIPLARSGSVVRYPLLCRCCLCVKMGSHRRSSSLPVRFKSRTLLLTQLRQRAIRIAKLFCRLRPSPKPPSYSRMSPAH